MSIICFSLWIFGKHVYKICIITSTSWFGTIHSWFILYPTFIFFPISYLVRHDESSSHCFSSLASWGILAFFLLEIVFLLCLIINILLPLSLCPVKHLPLSLLWGKPTSQTLSAWHYKFWFSHQLINFPMKVFSLFPIWIQSKLHQGSLTSAR